MLSCCPAYRDCVKLGLVQMSSTVQVRAQHACTVAGMSWAFAVDAAAVLSTSDWPFKKYQIWISNVVAGRNAVRAARNGETLSLTSLPPRLVDLPNVTTSCIIFWQVEVSLLLACRLLPFVALFRCPTHNLASSVVW